MGKDEKGEYLLTRDEVDREFGISRRYLEAAARRGEGPTMIRIGRAVRYRACDIRAWIDACAVHPKNGGPV